MADEHRARSTVNLLKELGPIYVIVDEPQRLQVSTPPTVCVTWPPWQGAAFTCAIRVHGRLMDLPAVDG